MNKTCIVLFPVYKPLDKDEQMSLQQAIDMTQGFTKKFIASHSFTFDESYNDFRDIEIERFDNHFFENIQEYNRLMLNNKFYERFCDYKYILIHQTDVYLFKPELQYWCEKDYDYIGAPWFIPRKLNKYRRYELIFRYLKPFFNKEKLLRWRHYNNVGNGGLSLRKVSSFLEVLNITDKNLLNEYYNNENHWFHEDIFWSLEAPEIKKAYKKPLWDEALHFSIESIPRESYQYIGKQLPFGCHAFKECDAAFWQQFIPFQAKINNNK